MDSRVNRRRFLGFTLGAVVVPVVGVAASASASEPEVAVVGEIKSVAADNIIVRVGTEDRSIILGSNARISRGPIGPLPDFGTFVVGDRIVVQGTSQEGEILATSVATPFPDVQATIESINRVEMRATTSQGSLRLENVRTAEGSINPGLLKVGDRLKGLRWTDPTTSTAEIVLASRL